MFANWENKLNGHIDALVACTDKYDRELKSESVKCFFVVVLTEFHGETCQRFFDDIRKLLRDRLQSTLPIPPTMNMCFSILKVIEVMMDSGFNEVNLTNGCKYVLSMLMNTGSPDLMRETVRVIRQIICFNLHDFNKQLMTAIDCEQRGMTLSTSLCTDFSLEKITNMLAKMLILNEVIINSPSTCYATTQPILELIQKGLVNETIETRIEANKALDEFFKVVKKDALFKEVMEKNLGNLHMPGEGDEAVIHGSLIAAITVLKNKFDEEYFYHVMKEVYLSAKNGKTSLIRRVSLLMLSDLCKISPEKFYCREPMNRFLDEEIIQVEKRSTGKIKKVGKKEDRMSGDVPSLPELSKLENEKYPFSRIVMFLLECFRSNMEKPTVFHVMGDLCMYFPRQMLTFFKMDPQNAAFVLIRKSEFEVLKKIKNEKERQDMLVEILYCFNKVVKYLSFEERVDVAVEQKEGVQVIDTQKQNTSITNLFYSLFCDVADCGLNEQCVELFLTFIEMFPKKCKPVKDVLIPMIRNILFTYNTPTTQTITQIVVMQPKELVILAIKVLTKLPFDEETMKLIVNTIKEYIDSEDIHIRKVVTKLTPVLLPENIDEKSVHVYDIGQTVQKLLVRGISDQVCGIRQTIMASFDSRFDYFLSQTANISNLFMALNDQNFNVRQEVIRIICRLTTYNLCFMMPSFRDILAKLISQLNVGIAALTIEESIMLLTTVIQSSGDLILPYSEAIIMAINPKLKTLTPTDTPTLLIGFLNAMTELICMGNVDEKYVKQTLETAMTILRQKGMSLQKTKLRISALRSIKKISRTSQYASNLYQTNPDLFELLMELYNTDKSQEITSEVVSVLGVLGAMDPTQYRMGCETEIIQVENDDSFDTRIPSVTTQTDAFYAWTVINSLLKILSTNTLVSLHPDCPRKITQTCQWLNQIKTPMVYQFLSFVFTQFNKLFPQCQPNVRAEIINSITSLLDCVDKTIRDAQLTKLFKMIAQFWDNKILSATCNLCSKLAATTKDEFKLYLPIIVPVLLNELSRLKYSNKDEDIKNNGPLIMNKCFNTFAKNIDLNDNLYSIVPVFLELFGEQVNTNLREAILYHIFTFFASVNISDYASWIISVTVSQLQNETLRTVLIEGLSTMAVKLGPQYFLFHASVCAALNKYPRVKAIDEFEKKLDKIRSSLDTLSREVKPLEKEKIDISKKIEQKNIASESVDDQNKYFELWQNCKQFTKEEEWSDWTERILIETIRMSPSVLIYDFHSIVSNNTNSPIARDLFNCAFHSYFIMLKENKKNEILDDMKMVITQPSVSHEVVALVLNLAEFLEHEELIKPIKEFGDCASKIGAYAKSLRAKENALKNENGEKEVKRRETIGEDDTPVKQKMYEELIGLNNQLQRKDAASGLIYLAEKENQMKLNSSWFAKLGMWHKALTKLEDEGGKRVDVKMECLYEMGDWKALDDTIQPFWNEDMKKWNYLESNDIKRVVTMVAASSFYMEHWVELKAVIESPEFKEMDPFDAAFYRIVYNLYEDNETTLKEAGALIEAQKSTIRIELGVLYADGYERCYNSLSRAEIITELEEILLLKKRKNEDGKHINKKVLVSNWEQRLINSQRDIKTWQRILKMRELVLDKREEVKCWIKFIGMCDEKGETKLGLSTLNMLACHHLEPTIESLPVDNLEVGMKYLNIMWRMTKDLNEKRGLCELLEEYKKRWKGEWSLYIYQSGNEVNRENIRTVLGHYKETISRVKDSHKYWQMWALVNLEVVGLYEIQKSNGRGDVKELKKLMKSYENSTVENKEKIIKEKQSEIESVISTINKDETEEIGFIEAAVNAFVQSLLLSKTNHLQDTLRLLTLLFKFGKFREVEHAVTAGINDLPVDIWLHVVPQIIARIQSDVSSVRRVTTQLLTMIGKAHPQAIVYALTVASKSPNEDRRAVAISVIEKIKKESGHLVQQAMLVSEELVGAAIIAFEMWKEALEEASKEFYNNKNFKAMMDVLKPMMMKLDMPRNKRDQSFVLMFGKDIKEAYSYFERYESVAQASDEIQYIDDLAIGWDILSRMYFKITNIIAKINVVELPLIAPRLSEARDLDIAVPGTYKTNQSVITIKYIDPILGIIPSKQRPRKLTIVGSDGKAYKYCLKGHEDLRQDERVMQLFGLVNDLLAGNSETSNIHLKIHCYDVIPLSSMSGLIGWVPHSDTLHQVVKEYRSAKNISVDAEKIICTKMIANKFDTLSALKKLEIFENVLEQSKDREMDLANAMWIKSQSSEMWLEKRTNFTRSVALMSMVGYILGLGDRHPQNLMLQRVTGDVVHIDFGDCFEVAMNREKYPEKIPFRLTRMMVNAMEVSGIEGTFRITCEKVMEVLRENKDSLMAVLEAFVYDPLIVTILGGKDRTEQTAIFENQDNQDNQDESKNKNEEKKDDEGENDGEDDADTDINSKAGGVTKRVLDKLTGKDFGKEVDVQTQVDKLIQQAMSHENLSQCYQGWLPFW
ncbi:serine/threonine protein kinase TOR1, putative [Entamoeba invadens IP1]|uniref:Serine/threonine-protein kinase TOR n=1 Tax=Entamoeba invadens IP1 TaxID=370355 RepID=A0A0A1TXZ3_ENTIV|nr:serine/threonine protein kinase TOR1, putative [Entamoeba invadens IP1]ELP86268.1 serine/threonine protein kinase TOR1, putative [Entamoeba invadens IP1]|eukprot:XP_004185614.1 serine/threonine protein kinase TOR1, putative [Entamoeba invadens IP1]